MIKCKNCDLPAVNKSHCEAHRIHHNELTKQSVKRNLEKVKARNVAWKKANPEKRREQWARSYALHKDVLGTVRTQAYRDAHPDCRDGEGKRYYAKHKEASNASGKAWYYANLERARENGRAWYYANLVRAKECALKNWHVRRARQLEATIGDFTKESWNKIVLRQGRKCIDCGKKRKLTIGHAVPLSRGGAHGVSNIIAQCGPCNSSQGTKIHPSVKEKYHGKE
jgi:5-methylcytosine-specific restriction endonuclease McrA